MKRFLSGLLVLLLIITMIPIMGVAEGENPYPDDYPKIYITSSKTISGDPGDSLTVPVTIKNDSQYEEAYNIVITARINNPDSVYIDGAGYDNLSMLSAGSSKKLSFDVQIDDYAKNGSYPIDINIKYEDFYGRVYEDTDTIYVRVSAKATSPQLEISRVDILPSSTITAGEYLIVGFELENKGDAPAKDIKVSLNGLSNNGFTLSSGLNNKTVQLIESGSKHYVYFELQSSYRMNAGSHELEMKLSYKDPKNTLIEDSNKLFVTVASNKDKASNLIIQNLSYPTGSVGQNKEVNLSFDIKNQGQMDAKNVIVTAESTDQNGLVPKSVSIMKLNNIAPGAVESVNFKFLTTASSETKNYPINIKVEYIDDLSSPGETYSVNQFVGIFVTSPDGGVKSTPKLIIDKYDFEPTLVKAGENFVMNLSFFNTNSQKTVRNIKIFLTSDERTDPNSNSAGGSVFTPVDSSNTFYIDSIPPKGRVEKKITMFTVPDALAKTYTLTANFEYEDNQGDQYTATELIGVPVIQQSRLEIGELSVFPEAYAFQSTPVSVQFYNTGKVTLYNMMVKLEGDFQVENGSYYVGNFTSGSQEYFEGYVIPNEPGELKGYLVFTYEDSTGKEQEIREEFTLNVMEQPPMPEFPGGEFPPFEEPKPSPLKSKWLWGGAIVLIVIVIFIIIKVRKKKKEKGLALDE